jgi:hypothetical protein
MHRTTVSQGGKPSEKVVGFLNEFVQVLSKKREAINHMNRKKLSVSILVSCVLMLSMFLPVSADANSINFEPPTYSVGNINGQDGWSKTGPFDSVVAANTYGYATYGTQTFRISNAVTSGSFGDQTFAKPLVDSVGEADATAGSFSEGTRQTHFEIQFDIASVQSTLQTGLFVSVSPDRGDGSRMSYLGFGDDVTGISVLFYDVQGTTNPATFVGTNVATGLDRSEPHTIKLVMDMMDGPSNDVVKVYINSVLVHTGTSWENYYRYDSEASAEQSPRIIKTVLFRAGGAAVPGNAGNGFLFDNLSLTSGPVLVGPPTSKEECKNDGWKKFNNPSFKNQGDCIKFVNTGK